MQCTSVCSRLIIPAISASPQAHPTATKPSREGEGVPWTAGMVGVADESDDPANAVHDDSRKFHTVTTASGTAVHWQARVHYYW